MKKVYIFMGTRPEALKLLPLHFAFQKVKRITTRIITTGQHREMLQAVLSFFGVSADEDFDLMTPDQSLDHLTAAILTRTADLLQRNRPDLVIVQGDTTTCFGVSLAAFYAGVPVAHVEAGLRSGTLMEPFPEEANRRMTSIVSRYHFAPTARALKALKAERLDGAFYQVGNTVVDALLMAKRIVLKRKEVYAAKYADLLPPSKEMVLITVHRRESFGKPLEQICAGIGQLAKRFPNIQFVYPVHLNPRVREVVFARLGQLTNVTLLDPVPYGDMVYLMILSKIILTDSGGIQEEAPSLGKPVIVLRNVTERPEGVEAGASLLAGTNAAKLVSLASRLLTDRGVYARMSKVRNPYGDGKSAQRIVKILSKSLR